MPRMPYKHIQKELEVQSKTQLEMAKVINRTHAVITNLFNGSRPLRVDEIPKLAKWLNKSENFILYGNDDAPVENNPQDATLKAAREQLNSAIEMWVKYKPDSLIHALAAAAYKRIRPSEKDKNLDSESTEMMMLSSVMGLPLLGENPNHLELAFVWWIAANDPGLLKNEVRTSVFQFIQTKGVNDIKKINREEFFKAITGDNINGA